MYYMYWLKESEKKSEPELQVQINYHSLVVHNQHCLCMTNIASLVGKESNLLSP